MTGEFGFCGYFEEFDHDLKDGERLQFARGEYPPPFDPEMQPTLPSAGWGPDRIARANRNYAVAYVTNGIRALVDVLGRDDAISLGCRAARLIGLQYYRSLAEMIGATDGDFEATAGFLAAMFRGMEDEVQVNIDRDNGRRANRTENASDLLSTSRRKGPRGSTDLLV